MLGVRRLCSALAARMQRNITWNGLKLGRKGRPFGEKKEVNLPLHKLADRLKHGR